MSPRQVQRNKDRVQSWKTNNKHNNPLESKDNGKYEMDNPKVESTECAFKDSSDTEINTASLLDSSQTNTTQSSGLDKSLDHDVGATAAEPQQASLHDKPQNNSFRRYPTRSRSQSHKRRPFRYKSVTVPLKCVHCERDYDLKPPTQSYFCTLCPAFVCTHCIDYGYHSEHYGTLKGPGTLDKIYDRYSR